MLPVMKQLFKLTTNNMSKTKETILQSIDDQHQLANLFGRFFLGKIDNIRNDLSSTRGSLPNDSDIFSIPLMICSQFL
jgi:hypothetical protein